jgi:hypothetical protein
MALAHVAHAKSKPKGKPATGRKPAAAAAKQQPKEPSLPPPQGKVAVFTFEGDGAASVQRHVIAALKAKGLKVTTGLRPVDSAEQYREMAVTLKLVAYIDGEASADGDQGSATVFVRSGFTGLRVASTTFAGERRTLAAEVGRGIWERLVADLAQVCADASKPRKAERPPLRIEAGTPIENRPEHGSEAAMP